MTLQHPRCKRCHTADGPCPRCEQEHRSALYLGRKLNTYRARITDLSNAGWIEEAGKPRSTPLETIATCWRVSERRAA